MNFNSLQMTLTSKGAFLGLCLGSHHQGVSAASLEMWLTALVAVRDSVFLTGRFSAQAPASINIPCLVRSVSSPSW